MHHARSDYNTRIQDSANLIPKSEPVFLIRGKDLVGPAAVEAWADLAEKAGASDHIVAAARRQAELMREYQEEHRQDVKVPDMKQSDVAVDITKQAYAVVRCTHCHFEFEYAGKSQCPNCSSYDTFEPMLVISK